MISAFRLAEEFVPVEESKPAYLNFTTTDIESLTKLLMYGNYVKARQFTENVTITDVIKEDLSHYPYTNKRRFKVVFQCFLMLLMFTL